MHFTKLQATGNDFILLEYQKEIDYSKLAQELCHRHYGIGADGVLVLDIVNKRVEIYNPDGSIAKMCGNGLRCVGAYLNRIESNKSWNIQIGEKSVKIEEDHQLYYINIGRINSYEYIEKTYYNTLIPMYLVDLGARHIVVCEELSQDHIEALQQEYDCNVNIVEVLDQKEFLVNTYERGVGWTWACGSGACASYYVLRKLYEMDDTVLVHQVGGDVLVSTNNNELLLIGSADWVFEGEYI